jgi:hypothetical protein
MLYWLEGDAYISCNVNTTDEGSESILLRLIHALKSLPAS